MHNVSLLHKQHYSFYYLRALCVYYIQFAGSCYEWLEGWHAGNKYFLVML